MINKANIQKWEVSKVITTFYMRYAMKTVIDRALPDVRDGFKPIHRKILFKMFDNKYLSLKPRAKSLTIVGDVSEIHGHGDGSIYDAMAMLTEQQEGQLHAYIDGEGAFGKQYSTDSPSQARYTFARLNSFTEEEIMRDIKKGVVKMIGEEHIQPLALPVTFPNILVKQNEGIAVGMSCYFPSFNLKEVCLGTKEYILNPEVDLMKYIKAPDFSTGGQLIYNENEMKKIIETGNGKLKIRSKYRYDKENNIIEIYEIPHNATANAIISQVTALMKGGFKDVLDIRDESGFNKKTNREELLIAIDIRKNTDVDKLMNFLFKKTSLERTISANLNCLVDYKPMVLSVKGILDNWLKFRRECIVNSIKYDVAKMEKDLHFLKGLEKILLDIDKTIEIIRKSKREEISINLIKYFNIDEEQANSVRRMRLENINEEYILEQTKNTQQLEEEVNNLKSKIDNLEEINKIIISQLEEVANKYGKPRKTEILYDFQEVAISTSEIENYNVMHYVTKEGYYKKVPLTSIRANSNFFLKEGDELRSQFNGENIDDVLIFTNKGNVFRLKAHEIKDQKLSDIGMYLYSELNIKSEEELIVNVIPTSYSNNPILLTVDDMGMCAKLPIEAFKSNYKKLTIRPNLIYVDLITDDCDVLFVTSNGKALIFNTSTIPLVATRIAKGVKGVGLKSENDNVVYIQLNPKNNDNITIETDNGKTKTISLNYQYYLGSRANVGTYIYNCKKENNKITNVFKK